MIRTNKFERNDHLMIQQYEVTILKVRSNGEVTAIFVPTKCTKELLSSLVPEELEDILTLSTSLVAVVMCRSRDDVKFSGIVWLSRGPLGSKYDYVEFSEGLYIPISDIVPTSCVFMNGKLIGCRYGLQKTVLLCDCSRARIKYINDTNKFLPIISKVMKELRDTFGIDKGIYAWVLMRNGNICFWELSS